MPIIDITKLKKLKHFGADTVNVETVSDLNNPKDKTLSFIGDKKYIKLLDKFKTGLLLVDTKVYEYIPKSFLDSLNNSAVVVLDNAYNNFIDIVEKYFSKKAKRQYKESKATNTIDKTAIIDSSVVLGTGVKIGAGVKIYPNVSILDNVSIGANTVIYPGVVIYDRVQIGSNVIIHANTVIGADGFGFLINVKPPKKIPHIGTVIIEDNVEVGASTCIDRGTVSNTIIGSGSKIDNFVQIAHNCVLGKNCVLSAMTGLSGSTILGDNVIMGANVGTKGHLKIGSNSYITARTSISKDVPENSVRKGYPARDLQEALKIQTLVGKLPNIYKRLINLEKALMEEKNANRD